MTFEQANNSIYVEDKEIHDNAIAAFGLKFSYGLCFKCDRHLICKASNANVSVCNFFKKERTSRD